MTDDNWPKIRRADPLMTMTIRVGRNGTVVLLVVHETMTDEAHVMRNTGTDKLPRNQLVRFGSVIFLDAF
jgi:hypothetical protein